MLNLEVKVHSLILEHGGAGVKLLYLCRALDVNGSGKATMNIAEVAENLKVSKRTLYRWVKNYKLFRFVIHHGNIWTIYYRSLSSIALSLQLPSWGACSYILISDLVERFSHKLVATEIIANSLQKTARCKVRRTKGRNAPPLLPSPADLFDSTSPLPRGVNRRGDELYVNLDDNTIYGGSQSTIGTILHKSRRTINKRLRNTQKLQVYVTSAEMYYLWQYAQFQDSENWTNTAAPYFQQDGKVYKSYICLYEPNYDLTSMRFAKGKYRNLASTQDWWESASQSDYDLRSLSYSSNLV